MHRFQSRQHIAEQPADLLLGQRFFPLQHLAERLAILIVHYDIGGAIRLEEIPHPHHTGVIDLGQDAGFVEKSFQTPGIANVLACLGGGQRALGVGQDVDVVAVPIGPLHREVFLDGRPGLQGLMHRLVRDAKPARPQHRLNTVLMQAITDWQCIGFFVHDIPSWCRRAESAVPLRLRDHSKPVVHGMTLSFGCAIPLV